MNYDIQFKGKIRHKNITAQDLVGLVSAGQIPGVYSYSPTDRNNWRPVFQMVHERNSEGAWEIKHQPQRPAESPSKSKIRHAKSVEPAAPAAASASPISVFIGSTGHEDTGSSESESSLTADSTAAGGLSILGLVVGLISVLGVLGPIVWKSLQTHFAIGGLIVALTGVVLSAFGVHLSRRRALGFTGLVIGILSLLGWAGFILVSVRQLRGDG